MQHAPDRRERKRTGTREHIQQSALDLPAPVARLDAAELMEALNRRSGTELRLIGTAPAGEVGAGFVEWPGGDTAVLTSSGAEHAEIARTGEILTRAAAAGLPVPQYELIADLGDIRAIIQTRLPGVSPALVTDELVQGMVALLDRTAGLGEDAPPIDLHLSSSGPGFCLHETLERSGTRTRRLLARIHEIGADRDQLGGEDLVHLDYHPGNILTDAAGRITGVVDWDGYGRGDRRFALVTLLFDLAHGHRFAAGYRRLSAGFTLILERLAELDPGVVRRWWAHMSLRQVEWTIRHRYPPGEVEHYLALAERGLDQLEHGPLTREVLELDTRG